LFYSENNINPFSQLYVTPGILILIQTDKKYMPLRFAVYVLFQSRRDVITIATHDHSHANPGGVTLETSTAICNIIFTTSIIKIKQIFFFKQDYRAIALNPEGMSLL
jgi:hypothetical protein